MKISVIIPTCEAELFIQQLLNCLHNQTVLPDEIIVIDSESRDNTVKLARNAGAKILTVQRKTFDHGGTRDQAFRHSTGDIVLFLTQDALPADNHYIERLIAPFTNERVAAASGRQLAKPDAYAYEKLVREYRYPEASSIWDQSHVAKEGIRAFRISDVCAAYRRSAYMETGGFTHPLMTNEDMLMAADLLAKGYCLAYCADAKVWHSHNFTLMQEYRRNRLIGRFLQRYSDRLLGVSETGEGLRLVKYVLLNLARKGQLLQCMHFCMNCAARLAGNKSGRSMEKKAMAHGKN